MACGEYGPGRMAEPEEIFAAIIARLGAPGRPAGRLAGRRVIVTSGPTHEPIDPVRYIANRSSGAQGSAIAAALHELGAEVVMVTGPATAPLPVGPKIVQVESAREMLAAVQDALPADGAVFAAAVADWRVVDASASSWWWASPPRPTTWSPTPPPSGNAKAATGSSPTTCAPRPGSWADRRTR